jgi:hypothetical protein
MPEHGKETMEASMNPKMKRDNDKKASKRDKRRRRGKAALVGIGAAGIAIVPSFASALPLNIPMSPVPLRTKPLV